MIRSATPLVALALAACPSPAATPTDSPPGGAPTGQPASSASSARREPIDAPAGVSVGGHVPPSVPSGAGAWIVDRARSSVTATVNGENGGRVTFSFRGGAAGALDGESGRAVFTVELAKLRSADAAGKTDPARDTAVLDGFFAARRTRPAELLALWTRIEDRLAASVPTAALVIDKVPISVSMVVSPPAKVNPEHVERTTIEAELVLWHSVSIPLRLGIELVRKDAQIEVKTSTPAKVDLEQALGPALCGLLLDATSAAGYPQASGFGAHVELSVEAVLTLSAE